LDESRSHLITRRMGWFMIAVAAIGLLNGEYLRLIRVLASPATAGSDRFLSAWFVIASAVWLLCGVATLRNASWPWAIAVGVTFCTCAVIVIRALIQPGSVISWVSAVLGLVLNGIWLAVLLRPSVRSAYGVLR
jgi:hypothetical protein